MDSAGEGMAIFDAMRARRAEGSGGVKRRGGAGDCLCAGPVFCGLLAVGGRT